MPQSCKGKVREARRALTLAYSTDSSVLHLKCRGSAATFATELEQLFLESGAALSLDSSMGQAGTEHGFALDPWGDAVTFPETGLSLVRGLPGTMKGLVPGLSLLLATVPQDSSADALRSLVGLLTPLVGESPRVLIVEQESAVPVFGQMFPRSDISLQEATEAVDILLSAPEQVDLLLLSPENGEVFKRLALGLTGTHNLSTTLERRNATLFSYHVAPEGVAVDPAALVLSAVSVLAATGRIEAAERLHNAVLRTLEEGVHTDALELLNPYSTRVPPERMIEAIASRLGQLPRRIEPARYTNHSRPLTARRRLKRVV